MQKPCSEEDKLTSTSKTLTELRQTWRLPRRMNPQVGVGVCVDCTDDLQSTVKSMWAFPRGADRVGITHRVRKGDQWVGIGTENSSLATNFSKDCRLVIHGCSCGAGLSQHWKSHIYTPAFGVQLCKLTPESCSLVASWQFWIHVYFWPRLPPENWSDAHHQGLVPLRMQDGGACW